MDIIATRQHPKRITAGVHTSTLRGTRLARRKYMVINTCPVRKIGTRSNGTTYSPFCATKLELEPGHTCAPPSP